MKSKINFKILYLVLAVSSLSFLLSKIEYFFFQTEINALIGYLYNIDVSEFSPPQHIDTKWVIVLLMFHGILFLVFGKLFFKAKEKTNSAGLSYSTIMKLTWLFLCFLFLAYFFFGFLKIVLLFTFIVIAIVKLRKANTMSLEVQENKEYNIESVRLDYVTLFNTMLALIIARTLIDIFTTILFNKSHPHPFMTISSIDLKYLINSGLLIMISLLIYFVHDKFKQHILTRISSLQTFVYVYTLGIFSMFFLLDWYTIANLFLSYVTWLFYEKSIILLIMFPLLAFFYFRKGKQLEKQGVSVTQLAFSALIYCMSGTAFICTIFINLYGLSLGVLVFLNILIFSFSLLLFKYNHKLSRFLSSRSLNTNNHNEFKN